MSAIESVLNNFKSSIFPMKSLDKLVTSEPTPGATPKPETATKLEVELWTTKTKTKCRIPAGKLREEFSNKIKKEEKNTNEQIFEEYFGYESPSFLGKDLYESNQSKNDVIIKYLNESFDWFKKQ